MSGPIELHQLKSMLFAGTEIPKHKYTSRVGLIDHPGIDTHKSKYLGSEPML